MNGTGAAGNRFAAVPRYYFHVIDDLDSPDTEGAELPGLEAARDYGARAALGLMADLLVRERRLALDHRIDIENEQGQVLDTVRFRNVVTIEG